MIRKALYVWFGLTALATILLAFLYVADAEGQFTISLTEDSSTKVRGTIDVGDVVARTEGNRAPTIEEVFAADFTFGFGGDVTSIQGNEWTVAGVTFSVTPNTLVTGSPQVGDRANVLAFSVNDRWYAMTLDKL